MPALVSGDAKSATPEHILTSSGRTDTDAPGKVLISNASCQFDWASTSAGPIERWSEPLKDAARLVSLSTAPMAVLIGRKGLVAPNDAMRDLFGTRHDDSCGKAFTPAGLAFEMEIPA